VTYLVDTNIFSELRKRSPEATAWIRSVDPASIHLSVVTVGELAKGAALKARRDPAGGAALSRWLDTLRHQHAGRILPIDEKIALAWALIAAERPRGMADELIAATARVHGMTVVTRNGADFADAGVPVLNPWDLFPAG